MLLEITKEADYKMKKAIEITKEELSQIRTGRASTALVEKIKIEYYGVLTPLKEIANITVPESDLIVIQPWDKNFVSEVEKAIWKADIGLTPNSDGTVIRLSIPPLSEERRKEIVKVVKKEIESGKVAIRNVRREINDQVKRLEKNSDISEDQSKEIFKKVQDLTDSFIKELDEICKTKEIEIMKV
ncbi:MAG: ribosome recycling factor [Atribacterota bacterium]|jgi:ribosome recycling factor|nr:ribosome recycling factor [Atribacterota bacterium]MDD4896037.1 ribosome recycling factor [Atribacterota bacterium]MDD5636302.1 ribosome recycling factor [Atribacterota bacterium]